MLHADSGRAVLMDFGIARPSEAVSSMTQTGTAIGTPHYMSPEQARGQVVDPRSDLYSLGVVLFLMLVGRVPFDADSAVAVGIKHVSEPIPRLPVYLHAFQGIINKILSKDPEHRYQIGDELIADLEAVPTYALAEVAAWESAHEQVEDAIDSGIDTAAETLVGQVAAPAQVPIARPSDSDITLSSEDRVAYREEESGSLWPWVAAVMLAAGVALAVFYQQQLPADYRLPLLSDKRGGSESQNTQGKGERSPVTPTVVAISETVNDGPADAESALPIVAFSAELKPDVLTTVPKPPVVAGAHLLSGAGEAGRADELNVPSNRDARLAEAADWVARGLADPQLATALIPQAADRYRQLLGRNPTDMEARQGLRHIREHIQQQAREALDLQRFSDVESLLLLAESTFPKAATEPKFQRLKKRMEVAVNVRALLEKAHERLQANAMTAPSGNNAAEYFKRVLVIKPHQPVATKGLEDIARRYAALATEQLAAGSITKAQNFVSRGLGVDAGNTRLKAIAERIEQQQSLTATLKQADQLRQQGSVLTPAGASALDAYRRVLAKQPRQAQALTALEMIEDDLVARIESFISSNNYQQATAEVSRALFFFPASQTLQGLQRINEQAIVDMLVASQPKISKVLVSNRLMATLGDAQQRMLAVDRIIHVGFYFKNFVAATSVVQAVLFDGARRLQIAQVPVIVSGQEGAQFFRIERPVEGFADGGYSIDLMLEGQRLSSAAFEVGRRSEL